MEPRKNFDLKKTPRNISTIDIKVIWETKYPVLQVISTELICIWESKGMQAEGYAYFGGGAGGGRISCIWGTCR